MQQAGCMKCVDVLMDSSICNTPLLLVASLTTLFPTAFIFHPGYPLSPLVLWQLFGSFISLHLFLSLPVCKRISMHITTVAEGRRK